jgi:hypothetical protein
VDENPDENPDEDPDEDPDEISGSEFDPDSEVSQHLIRPVHIFCFHSLP